MNEISIATAFTDRRLLGAALGDISTWATWLVILKAAFGLPLDEHEQQLFASVAGNRKAPAKRVRELWAIVGRRGGKSRIAALVAVFIALFVRHRLAAGEKGMVLVLAASVEQARTVFGYVQGFLESAPALRKEVDVFRRQDIELRCGVTIAVHANSFRTVRGRTLVACIFDEVAFWRDETSAAPDIETYRAVLPSLATTNGMLVGISTPYRKIGLLHQKHRDHFGVDDDETLVVKGASKAFNPSLSERTLAAQRAADPEGATSEWDAEFRDDRGAFLDDALIEAAVERGRPLELPPQGGYTTYYGFADASGGVGADSYTLAIGHKDDGRGHFVIDLVRGTSGKFNPQVVTKEYADLCREYNVISVTGDHYGAEWVAGVWQEHAINYMRSELPKSQIYLETIPLFTRGLVRLPDHPKLLRELRLLERQTHRGGRDTVDHPRGGHDDFANSVCGVLHQLSLWPGYDRNYRGWDLPGPANYDYWDRLRFLQHLRAHGMPW